MPQKSKKPRFISNKLDSSGWQALLATKKNDTRVIGPIQRMLLMAERDTERRTDVLHPSEICKTDWCPRASYYKITGAPAAVEENPSIWLQKAFEDGHFAHDKWQQWCWSVGILRGWFSCLSCEQEWHDTSPTVCPQCEAPRRALRYREVRVVSEEYMIEGRADGELDDGHDPSGIEVKTIGVGTVRAEAPELLAAHQVKVGTKTILDHDGLWQAIKQPFAVHRRQGHLYGTIMGWSHMYFIYDCKWNAKVAEFKVKVDRRMIEPIFDAALVVKKAVEERKVPRRPIQANPTKKMCTSCPYHAVCWGEDRSSDVAGEGSHRPRIVRVSAELRGANPGPAGEPA